MAMNISAPTILLRVKPFFRIWLLVATFWWAYLAWGYWGYKIPKFDPKPLEPLHYEGLDYAALADIPADYFSPANVAYRAQMDAYNRRREVSEKLFWFSLPISIPLALWVGANVLIIVGGWATNTGRKP